MAQEVTNFARFYAAFNHLPCTGDRDEFKKSIVMQYTWNRTDSLREMTRKEYFACCDALERMSGYKERQRQELRRCRSSALHQLQLYGIDTTDWTKVNAFCEQPRIAGKLFRELGCEELEALTKKMRAIIRKRVCNKEP